MGFGICTVSVRSQGTCLPEGFHAEVSNTISIKLISGHVEAALAPDRQVCSPSRASLHAVDGHCIPVAQARHPFPIAPQSKHSNKRRPQP